MPVDCLLGLDIGVSEAIDVVVLFQPHLTPLKLDLVVLEEQYAPWQGVLALVRLARVNFVAECRGKLQHRNTAQVGDRIKEC